MGCGASVEGGSNGASPSKGGSKIKVKRPRRFEAKNGLHDAFSTHAKLSMYMLFAHYDVDASGQIDANELYQMMLDSLPIFIAIWKTNIMIIFCHIYTVRQNGTR